MAFFTQKLWNTNTFYKIYSCLFIWISFTNNSRSNWRTNQSSNSKNRFQYSKNKNCTGCISWKSIWSNRRNYSFYNRNNNPRIGNLSNCFCNFCFGSNFLLYLLQTRFWIFFKADYKNEVFFKIYWKYFRIIWNYKKNNYPTNSDT